MDNDVEKRFEAFVELVKASRAAEKRRLQNPNDYALRREDLDYKRRVDQALIELAGGKAPTLFPDPDGAA